MLRASLFAIVLTSVPSAFTAEPKFPVRAELLVDGRFEGAEGIACNGEGRMFVTADRALWEVTPSGDVSRIVAGLHTTVGITGIGERDILIADFGPTNVWQHGPNDDGIVWRVTPGEPKRVFATGIGDPNFILVRADGFTSPRTKRAAFGGSIPTAGTPSSSPKTS